MARLWIKPCSKPVWCNKCWLRPEGPKGAKDKTNSALGVFLYHLHKHINKCLCSIPYSLIVPLFLQTWIYWKTSQMLQKWWESQPCMRSSVCSSDTPINKTLYIILYYKYYIFILYYIIYIIHYIIQSGLGIGWRGWVKSFLHLPMLSTKLDV